MDPELVRELQHLRELMKAQEELDKVRHNGESRALELASADIDRRLTEMNLFREQLNDERGLYVTRELHDKLEKDLNSELDKIRNNHDERLKILELAKGNLEGKMWVIGVFFLALQIALRYWK